MSRWVEKPLFLTARALCKLIDQVSEWVEKPLFLTARALCKLIDQVSEWVAKRKGPS